MTQSIATQALKHARLRFCDRLTRRFRFVLGRVICEVGQPLDNQILEQVASNVSRGASTGFVAHARLVLASSPEIKAQADLGPAGLFARNSVLDKSTRTLLHTVKTLLRRQMQEYFARLAVLEQVNRELEAGIGELEDYASSSVHDLNVSVLDILEIDLLAMVKPKRVETTEPNEPVCELLVESKHILVDAFGRAILVPVERMYGVGEIDDDQVLGAQRFPRPFCGPVLEVLRSYVIGIDKYNLLNQTLLKSLRRHLDKMTLEVDECREVIAGQALQKQVAGHCLHILKILTQAVRRENFAMRMNLLLVQRHPDLYLEFNYRHVNMLTKAWAFFVHKQMEIDPESQTAEILSYFLPGYCRKSTDAA